MNKNLQKLRENISEITAKNETQTDRRNLCIY